VTQKKTQGQKNRWKKSQILKKATLKNKMQNSQSLWAGCFLRAPGMGVIYRVRVPNREGSCSG
jgi:hypothetical protein